VGHSTWRTSRDGAAGGGPNFVRSPENRTPLTMRRSAPSRCPDVAHTGDDGWRPRRPLLGCTCRGRRSSARICDVGVPHRAHVEGAGERGQFSKIRCRFGKAKSPRHSNAKTGRCSARLKACSSAPACPRICCRGLSSRNLPMMVSTTAPRSSSNRPGQERRRVLLHLSYSCASISRTVALRRLDRRYS